VTGGLTKEMKRESTSDAFAVIDVVVDSIIMNFKG
jgi:hypothetical protein